MIDDGWITKTQAAERLGVDERTIERRARAGHISAKARPGFPTLYRAADVENLRQATPGDVHTGLLEAGPAVSSNGHGPIATVRTPAAVLGPRLIQLLDALLNTLEPGPTGATGPTDVPTGPTAPTSENPFLTLAEAAAYRRVSEPLVLRWMRTGMLPFEREPRSRWTPADRGYRIRRRDLEAV